MDCTNITYPPPLLVNAFFRGIFWMKRSNEERPFIERIIEPRKDWWWEKL